MKIRSQNKEPFALVDHAHKPMQGCSLTAIMDHLQNELTKHSTPYVPLLLYSFGCNLPYISRLLPRQEVP